MDGAYVKFMMCQCLRNRADWGLAIGCMNIVFSFFLFQFWVVEFINSLANYPVKWVLLYGCNVMFNIVTMMRIVKRESISVFYWICETGAVLIFRIHHIYYEEDNFWLAGSKLYKVSNIVIDVYNVFSLLAMIYVMCGLHLEPDRHYSHRDLLEDYKYDPQDAKGDSDLNDDPGMKELKEKPAHLMVDSESLPDSVVVELFGMSEPTAPSESKILFADDSDYDAISATAPEEFSSIELTEMCAPTAPPESQIYWGEDSSDEIEL